MAGKLKDQFHEHMDRELDRRGMSHHDLAEMISQAREGRGRGPINTREMAKNLKYPRTDTGISSAAIEEICELIGVIPVLTLISPPMGAREGAVPDDRDLALLVLCDRDDMVYRESIDSPEMNRLRTAGLVDIGGAEYVSWYATEAGRQLLDAAAPIGVCEYCRRYMYPGQTQCSTPRCCGELVERPCEICSRLYASEKTCSGTIPEISETGERIVRILDPLDPPDQCPKWTPDEEAYHRRLFQVAERGILVTGD